MDGVGPGRKSKWGFDLEDLDSGGGRSIRFAGRDGFEVGVDDDYAGAEGMGSSTGKVGMFQRTPEENEAWLCEVRLASTRLFEHKTQSIGNHFVQDRQSRRQSSKRLRDSEPAMRFNLPFGCGLERPRQRTGRPGSRRWGEG